MNEGLKTASFKQNKILYMFLFYINMSKSGSFIVSSVDIVRLRENGLLIFFTC